MFVCFCQRLDYATLPDSIVYCANPSCQNYQQTLDSYCKAICECLYQGLYSCLQACYLVGGIKQLAFWTSASWHQIKAINEHSYYQMNLGTVGTGNQSALRNTGVSTFDCTQTCICKCKRSVRHILDGHSSVVSVCTEIIVASHEDRISNCVCVLSVCLYLLELLPKSQFYKKW